MNKTDRRIERTRHLLQQALIELIGEHGYDALTIRDIVDRANVGRTTFYQHFNDKDDLFMSCHKAIVSDFHFGSRRLHSREDLLAPDAPAGLIAAFRHLNEAQALMYSVFHGEHSRLILRRIRDESAQDIEASLRAAFDEVDSAMPFSVLATYLAGARIAMVQWWLEKRQPYDLENLVQTLHRMQRAAIRDALGFGYGE